MKPPRRRRSVASNVPSTHPRPSDPRRTRWRSTRHLSPPLSKAGAARVGNGNKRKQNGHQRDRQQHIDSTQHPEHRGTAFADVLLQTRQPGRQGKRHRQQEPNAKMNPSNRNRVRIQPPMSTDATASPFQICCNKLCSAASTVVAPINRLTIVTTVAMIPCACCEFWIAANKTLATEGPTRAFSCAPICGNRRRSSRRPSRPWSIR